MAVKLFKALRVAIMEADISHEDLAFEIGLLPTALSQRLNGKVDFRMDEVYRIKELLKIPDEDLCYYFPRGGKSKEVILRASRQARRESNV